MLPQKYNKYRVWLVPILIFIIGGYAVLLDYKIKKQNIEFHQEMEFYKQQLKKEIQKSFDLTLSRASNINSSLDEVNQMLDSTYKDSLVFSPQTKLNQIEY